MSGCSRRGAAGPVRLGVGAGLLVLLAACSGGSEATGPAPSVPAPPPGATPPAGFTPRTVGALSFSTPADWQEVPATGRLAPAGDQLQLVLRAPGAEGASAPVALALLDRTPARSAAAEVDSLVTVRRDVERAQDVRSDPLAVPGFTTAVLVQYEQPGPSGQATHTDVLVGDLADGTLVTLTVKADRPDYDAGQLAAVARTAAVAGRAAGA